MSIPASTAYTVLMKAYLSTDHVSPATGKTLAVVLSKAGAAFGNPNAGASNATEVTNGWYKFALDATDTNTVGDLVVRLTGTGVDDAERVLQVVNANTGGLGNLDAAVSSRLATGNVTVGAYAGGQDPATLVLDVAASGHNTANTIGAKINSAASAGDPLGNTVPGSYAVGTAGYNLGRIGTTTVTLVSPVATSLDVTVFAGDSYFAADGRALTWTDTGNTWPDLTGATVTVTLFPQKPGWVATAAGSVTVASGSGKTVKVELTAVQTTGMYANRYPYHLTATLQNGHVVTLVSANWTVTNP